MGWMTDWINGWTTELSESIDLLHVKLRFYCPQAFLSLDLHCRMDVSVPIYTFQDCKEPEVLHMVQGVWASSGGRLASCSPKCSGGSCSSPCPRHIGSRNWCQHHSKWLSCLNSWSATAVVIQQGHLKWTHEWNAWHPKLQWLWKCCLSELLRLTDSVDWSNDSFVSIISLSACPTSWEHAALMECNTLFMI